MDSIIGQIQPATSPIPAGWLPCHGQQLPINGNEALFSLLGFTFGGGSNSFGVPDLRGRRPIHASPALPFGQIGGDLDSTVDPPGITPWPVGEYMIAIAGDFPARE
jgi:microcystin-dependent protein